MDQTLLPFPVPQDVLEVVKLCIAVVCLACAVYVWRHATGTKCLAAAMLILTSMTFVGCAGGPLVGGTLQCGPLGCSFSIDVQPQEPQIVESSP